MKICFWGNIAEALNGRTAGGGELQIALLAKTLAKSGHEVVIIDLCTANDYTTIDGIQVFKINGWNDGIRIIRTFTHRLPKLYSILKAQKADVYYCRIRDFRHILSFWAARKVKAKFILALASDLDAMNFLMRLKYTHLTSLYDLWSFFNNILIEITYPWLLRKADLVLVQHEGQKDILKKRQIKSLVYPNIYVPGENIIMKYSHNYFIYVGSLDKRKGIIEFFKLVEKSPSHLFKVVGQPRDKIGQASFEKLKSLKNVSLLGRLNHIETIFQITNSKALISTSPMEGFPNIFIEAWANGIPVLSLYVNPGDIISKEKLGIACNGDLNKLVESLDIIENSKEFARRAKHYVQDNHTLNKKKINETNRLIKELYM